MIPFIGNAQNRQIPRNTKWVVAAYTRGAERGGERDPSGSGCLWGRQRYPKLGRGDAWPRAANFLQTPELYTSRGPLYRVDYVPVAPFPEEADFSRSSTWDHGPHFLRRFCGQVSPVSCDPIPPMDSPAPGH